jgi:hypothetical protein
MTRSSYLGAGAAGLVPPSILIFFHMPKTGGLTMGLILEHCFPGDQYFNAYVGVQGSAILGGSRTKIAAKYDLLSAEAKQRVRAVFYEHVPMGIHTLFDRSAKYFTIVRHPVDRVVSHFYYMRTRRTNPFFEQIKDMTLEQYLDHRIGLNSCDLQVRMLSGCKELDGPWGMDGKPVAAAPVEGHHLDVAKRNVEEYFLTAAPYEEFATLVVLLKRLYGWKLRRCLFERQNVTPNRPRVADLQAATRRRIEDCNRHDMALYEWTKARFADQVRTLEPQIFLDRLLFNIVNNSWQHAGPVMPENLRMKFTNWLCYS